MRQSRRQATSGGAARAEGRRTRRAAKAQAVLLQRTIAAPAGCVVVPLLA